MKPIISFFFYFFSSIFFTQSTVTDINSCSEALINASATEVCTEENVDLSVNVIGNSFSNWASGEPNNVASGTEHFGLFLSTGRWNDGPDSYTFANCIVESETNLGVVNNFTYLGFFENHHYYLYDLTDGWNNCNNLAVSLGGYLAIINSQLETNFIFNNLPTSYDRGWIGMYQDTNHPEYSEPGGAWFWVDGTPVAMSSNPSTYAWSTGDTSETITVTPTETTEYWVDVTTNSVTCREYITIDVTAPASPTGNIEQTFCAASTVADLSATGENIQWYDAAAGGSLLDSTTALTDGQMVYASQTVNGCESTERLEVTVSIHEITITASATEVCAGESVEFNINIIGNNFSNWASGEPNQVGLENWGEIYGDIVGSESGKWNDSSVNNNLYSAIEYNGLINSLPGCNYIGQLNGHSYFYKEINNSWAVARDHAISLGAYLVIISSEIENNLIWQNIPIPNGYECWIGMYQDTNHPEYSEPGGAWFWVDGTPVAMSSNPSTYAWSTGDTTPNLTVTPSETTDYWVDVTTNGVTCREYITISVQDITINASATEVCAEESVDLTVSSGLTAGTTACNSAGLPANLQTGLVGYWPFCGNANDESGNGNNGTVNGATLTTDRFGNAESAYNFDGEGNENIEGDSINLGELPVNIDNQNDYTFSFWVKSLPDTDGAIITCYSNGLPADSEFFIGIFNNSSSYPENSLVFGGDGTGGAFSSYQVNTSDWQHIALIYSGNQASVYLNSNFVYNEIFNINSIDSNLDTIIGGSYCFSLSTFCNYFGGDIDDMAIWNRALTPSEIQQLANSSTYSWSTGDTTSTVSVTPSETTEYWVDVTTSGVTCREYITISVQDITINASATEVCAGESVDLSVVGDVNSTYLWSTGESNFSGQGTLVDEYSLVANTVSQNTFSITPGNIYRLEVSGTISLGGGAGNQRDVAYYIQSGSDGTVEGTPFDSECNLRIWTSLFCENPGLRPSPDIYDPINHTYSYPFTSNSSSLEVGFWDSPLGDNGPNVVTFKLYELSNSESIITVNATETTEYWVDVTINGVTCREYITIDVTAPPAPTGNSVQGGCSDFSVGSNNNAFTGENLQWYAAPSGGTALPDSHLLVDGTYYYISQTVDGCESSDRFEFLYLAPQPTITIDSPVICEGDSSTVSITSSPSLGSATFLWNTGETSDSITLSPTESTTFWVDQIYSSGGTENIQTVCRYFFGINVDNAPEAPISGGDITECETNEAQNLVATASANAGESITWYDAATGGNVVANPSLGTAGTVTFFAEATNDNSGCASLTRTALTITITSVAAPTGDAVQSFCDNVTVSDLLATGSNIQWYDADTGGNILDSSSPLTDGQVLYASQTQNGCESITRLEVSVEIDVIPDPILITTELEFCLAREATLADLEVDEQGFALEWYDSFNGGNMLPMDTLLEDGISYYTTLYDAVSGCESLMRLEVVPTVIPCEVIIYNALSLNGNGQNDYMVIENAEYFPDNSLEVYNRDGHLIYSQTQYGVDDNLFRGVANVGNIYGGGTIYNSSSGSNLPTGSYLYVFKYFNPYEQQQYTLKGFLTINSN